jgi:hypothetical protein
MGLRLALSFGSVAVQRILARRLDRIENDEWLLAGSDIGNWRENEHFVADIDKPRIGRSD